MKNNVLSVALLAGMLALSPLAVTAQPSDSARAKNMEKMFADLNLTKDQKEKLTSLHEALNGSHKQVFDQMKALREKIKAELLKQQPSKQVLDGYVAQFGDLHKQLAQKRIDHMLRVKAILTPEQFAKLLSREDNSPGGPRGKRWKDGKGPGGEEMDDR